MAWISRTTYSPSDRKPNYTDLNSWGQDIRTWGGTVDAAGNALANLGDLTWLTAADRKCKVFISADQSIANISETTITWDSEGFDPSGMHSTSSNTDRITIAVAGYYEIRANLVWADNSTGQRLAVIKRISGATTTYLASNGFPTTPFSCATQVAVCEYLLAGDYVIARGYQNSGGALNIKGPSALGGSWFEVIRLI